MDLAVLAALAAAAPLAPTCGHGAAAAAFTATRAPPGSVAGAVICEACFQAYAAAEEAARVAALPPLRSAEGGAAGAASCMNCGRAAGGSVAVRLDPDVQWPYCDECRARSAALEATAAPCAAVKPDRVMGGMLYIGPKEAAYNAAELERLGIRRVLVCCNAIRPPLAPSSDGGGGGGGGGDGGNGGGGAGSSLASGPTGAPTLRFHRLDMRDSLTQDLAPLLPHALAFIAEGMIRGEATLVHCNAGVSRSGAVVVEFLRRTLHLSLDEALAEARRERDVILPNSNFMAQLRASAAAEEAAEESLLVELRRQRASGCERSWPGGRMAAEPGAGSPSPAGAAAEQQLAYARAERDRAALRASARARMAAAAAPADDDDATGREALASIEARLAASESAALVAFAGQGGGPCAYTRLGEQLIDVLADVALAGFAAELAPARFLCNETFEIREPGAVADVLWNALEAQCGASAARAARREEAELPTGNGEDGDDFDSDHPTATIPGTTQLIRAAACGDVARVRTLVALGAPRTSGGRLEGGGGHRFHRWSAAAWAIANRCERARDALLVVPSPFAVSTLAGSGAMGSADGERLAAQFNEPCALALLPDGSVIVADAGNHCVRLIAADGGGVSTLAGRAGGRGFADGPAAEARFHSPTGLVCCTDGSIFVADCGNKRVRRIKDGTVTTFAGSGKAGGADGVGAAASFDGLIALSLGPGGVLFVAEDAYGRRVRMISPAGVVSTLAGGRGAATGYFVRPAGVAVDDSGVVFVTDRDGACIHIVASGVSDMLTGSAGVNGFADGPGAAAQFNRPTGLVIDPVTGLLLVADTGNSRIRTVDPRTGAAGTLAGTGARGAADGDAAVASFRSPCAIAVDAQGGILVADAGNHLIRRIARRA